MKRLVLALVLCFAVCGIAIGQNNNQQLQITNGPVIEGVGDSWAVIAYLEGEAAAERVADHIADAHENDIPLFISVVNAGEVWYIIARETSLGDADRSQCEGHSAQGDVSCTFHICSIS